MTVVQTKYKGKTFSSQDWRKTTNARGATKRRSKTNIPMGERFCFSGNFLPIVSGGVISQVIINFKFPEEMSRQ